MAGREVLEKAGGRVDEQGMLFDPPSGFFYEVQEGMTPEEAERVYQYVYEKVSDVVCELPFNYSMADGLLYLARAKAQVQRVPQPTSS